MFISFFPHWPFFHKWSSFDYAHFIVDISILNLILANFPTQNFQPEILLGYLCKLWETEWESSFSYNLTIDKVTICPPFNQLF